MVRACFPPHRLCRGPGALRRLACVGFALVILAACTQYPAPVRIANPVSAGDTPPLPPELPLQRQVAQLPAMPPLPAHKPAVPGSSTAITTLPAPSGEPVEEELPLASVAAALLQPAAAQAPAERPEEAAVGYVTVLPGDTVYAISRRYDVAVKDIIALNDMKEPYTLFVGRDIRLPSRRYHTVAPGESLSAIATRYGLPPQEIVAANDLVAPYTLFVGQRLAMPGIEADGSRATAPLEQSAGVTSVAVPAEVAMPSRGNLQFVWPVEGPILSTFGAKDGGLHNDGINIGAPAGAPVRAAEQGVVAYVGNELRGYGNLILIKHADGWVSAYAHNSEVRVARGQEVSRGQIIGAVGSTGGVSSPQSHFELRRDGQAVDPTSYLVRL